MLGDVYKRQIARTTSDAINVLDALGVEVILVETLGVGQGEVAITPISDLTLVVLQPGTGDEVQMLKAGVLETGDLYVVNKADISDILKLIPTSIF